MKAISAQLRTLGSFTPEEVSNFVTWVTSIPNSFDSSVMGYPRTVMAEASADGEPFMMVPCHPCLMLESLAPAPGTPVLQIARGLQEISAAVDQAGKDAGFGEAFFLTNSEPEKQLCEKRGWKSVLYDPVRKTHLMKRVLPRPDFRTP